MRADLVNLVTFADRAKALIVPHVADLGYVNRSDRKYLGSAFMAPEVKAALTTAPSKWVIEVEVKTSHYAGMYTDSPKPEATWGANALAKEYGLTWKWEPNEKGWGSFVFAGAEVAA